MSPLENLHISLGEQIPQSESNVHENTQRREVYSLAKGDRLELSSKGFCAAETEARPLFPGCRKGKGNWRSSWGGILILQESPRVSTSPLSRHILITRRDPLSGHHLPGEPCPLVFQFSKHQATVFPTGWTYSARTEHMIDSRPCDYSTACCVQSPFFVSVNQDGHILSLALSTI